MIDPSNAYDPDPLDPQHFSFLDSDPQKYADPRIQIQGQKNIEKEFYLIFNLKYINIFCCSEMLL